jgi:hypothetical protein
MSLGPDKNGLEDILTGEVRGDLTGDQVALFSIEAA